MRKKIYLYNNWHNGDIIYSRPLIRALAALEAPLAVGSFKNMYYLVQDLPVLHRIAQQNEEGYAKYDLLSICPEGFVPVNHWLGQYDDTRAHNWQNIVTVFNRLSEEKDLGVSLPRNDEVPMIDFAAPTQTIEVKRPAVYVENGSVRSKHCNFEYDIADLVRRFPKFHFYCSAPPNCQSEKAVDLSHFNLVDLSFVSNECDVLVGKGSGPFNCTYTETNRYKPKAVVGFTALPFWDYPNNPLEYLPGDKELNVFLKGHYEKLAA